MEMRSLEGVTVAHLLGQLMLFHIERDSALLMSFFAVRIMSSNQFYREFLADDCVVLQIQLEDGSIVNTRVEKHVMVPALKFKGNGEEQVVTIVKKISRCAKSNKKKRMNPEKA